MNKLVNVYYIGAVLEPFLFLEDNEELFQDLDYENEVDVKNIIKSVLKPHFHAFDENSKVIVKNSLGYFLYHDSDMWESIFAMNHPQFDLPSEPIKFYKWLWEILFENDDYEDEGNKEYFVNNDIDKTNGIKICSDS